MQRRTGGILIIAAFVVVASSKQAVAAPPAKPNVVFILADDLGWGDLGCYGHGITKTPNLDKLAASGVQFTNFYVNASVCSPSRCAFFTGQYPARQKIHGHYATPEQNQARGMSQFLDPQVPSVACLLKSAGYATAHVGKWHLGSNSGGPDPSAYGFDFVGTGEREGADGPKADPYFRARSTETFVNESLKFIEQNKDGPFYLQLWTLVPHATLSPTPEQLAEYQNLRAGSRDFPHASAQQIFSASVTDLDTQIGRLIAGLEKLGLREKTLILFSSDNGPEDIHIRNAGHSGVGSAGPFRGRKRSLYEGGVRVPGLVSWPSVIAPRIENEAIMSGVDWLPTVCKWAGVELAADQTQDGEELTNVLLGKAKQRTKPLYWEWRFNIAGEPFHRSPILAMRDGKWKLLFNPDNSRVELYDLSTDPTQLNNVAEHNVSLVEAMKSSALAWQKELPTGPIDPSAGKMTYPWPGTKREPAQRRGGGKAGAKKAAKE
ncbi:MAG: sulfatase-like hydrolase/transferase [Pirellulales bacterium]